MSDDGCELVSDTRHLIVGDVQGVEAVEKRKYWKNRIMMQSLGQLLAQGGLLSRGWP